MRLQQMRKHLLWASEITHWVKKLATKTKDPVQTQSSHSRRTELIPDLHMFALVSLNKWVDKENVMCVHIGVLLSH